MELSVSKSGRQPPCSSVRSKLENLNFDISHLDSDIIDGLLSNDKLCPEDKFYLSKISDLVHSSKEKMDIIEKFIPKYEELTKKLKDRHVLIRYQKEQLRKNEIEIEDLVYTISELKKDIQQYNMELEDLTYKISQVKPFVTNKKDQSGNINKIGNILFNDKWQNVLNSNTKVQNRAPKTKKRVTFSGTSYSE